MLPPSTDVVMAITRFPTQVGQAGTARHGGTYPQYMVPGTILFDTLPQPGHQVKDWQVTSGLSAQVMGGRTDIGGTASQQSLGVRYQVQYRSLWLASGLGISRLHYTANVQGMPEVGASYPGTLPGEQLSDISQQAIFWELPLEAGLSLPRYWNQPLQVGLGVSMLYWPSQDFTYRYANVGIGNTDTYPEGRQFIYFGQLYAVLGTAVPLGKKNYLDVQLLAQQSMVPLGVEQRHYTMGGFRAVWRWPVK